MKTKGLILTVLTFISLSISAQETNKRIGFEFNSGVSLATEKIDNASLNPGFMISIAIDKNTSQSGL